MGGQGCSVGEPAGTGGVGGGGEAAQECWRLKNGETYFNQDGEQTNLAQVSGLQVH
jgi:hypothetical protein